MVVDLMLFVFGFMAGSSTVVLGVVAANLVKTWKD